MAPLLYPLAGVALIWIMFMPNFVTGLSALPAVLAHDIGFQWIPFKDYNRWAWSLGCFPLWNPYVFAGMPFLAFSHSAALYPLGWIVTLFDYAKAVNFYYPLHLSIGFLGLYLLLRNLKLGRAPSLLAALSAVLSAKFFYFIHFLPSANSNFWGIWFFFFLVKMTNRKSAWFVAGMALALALEFLGGDFESTCYQLLSAPFFLLALPARRAKLISPVWGLFVIAIALGILLSFAQTLPLAEYSRFFLRSAGFSFGQFESRMLPAKLAWALVFPLKNPGYPGVTPDAPVLYLGLLLIFFPFAALLLQRKLRLFLLAAVTLLFSFGSIKPLDWLVFHIPLLNRFGAQEHSFFLFQIFWAMLAAYGMDHALRKRPAVLAWFFGFGLAMTIFDRVYFAQTSWRAGLILIFGLALLSFAGLRGAKKSAAALKTAPILLFLIFLADVYAAAVLSTPGRRPEIFGLIEPLQQLRSSAGQSGARSVVVSRMGVDDPDLPYHLGMRTRVGTIDGWITTPPLRYAKFLDLIEPRSVKFKDGKVDKFEFNVAFREGDFLQSKTMPLLDLLSLKYFLARGQNLKFASPFSLNFSADDELYFSAGQSYSHQVYFEDDDVLKTGFRVPLPSSVLFLAITFTDQSGSHLVYARMPAAEMPLELTLNLKRLAGRPGKLSLTATEIARKNYPFALVSPRIENPDKPIQRIVNGQIEIFRNREAFPEAFLVHSCRWVPDDDKLLAELPGLSEWELSREVILSAESVSCRVVKSTGEELKARYVDLNQLKEPVEKVVDLPDRLVFKTYALKPAYFFLNHQYLPGWKVFVDRREWRIERTDYTFQSVFLDQGPHTIEFRYQPAGFAVGFYVGLATLFSLLVWGGTLFGLNFSGKNGRRTPPVD